MLGMVGAGRGAEGVLPEDCCPNRAGITNAGFSGAEDADCGRLGSDGVCGCGFIGGVGAGAGDGFGTGGAGEGLGVGVGVDLVGGTGAWRDAAAAAICA